MMTPMLTAGDAIGNYMVSLQRVLATMGVSVWLYADYVDPAYRHTARPTSAYRPTGSDILWFHYSIWSENFEVLDRSADFKVMDYHGVTPPPLMRHDPRLAALCDKAIQALPSYRQVFDWCVHHSDFARLDLERAGYAKFSKVHYPVDTTVFGRQDDETLATMLRPLEYILFVSRVVPQKDVLSILRVFAEVQKRRPRACLLLVGGIDLLPAYVQQVKDEIQRLDIEKRVQVIGKISERDALSTLFRYAKFLICLSDWESFFVPALEAMYFGVPVIHTGEPPVSENVGTAGVAIDKRNPVDAASQINAIWDDDVTYSRLRVDALRLVLSDWAMAFEKRPPMPIVPGGVS
jgi:glycosyltransferase involved in cell wall biosynthesis